MTVAYQVPTEFGPVVRVVVKGAPEEIIPHCNSEKNSSNYGIEFEGSEDQGTDYLEKVASKIASQGYKPLTVAFKDISIEDFEKLQYNFGNFESEESRTHLETNLQLVATFGFQDVLR